MRMKLRSAWKQALRKKGSFYRKSLIWFLVAACLPGLVIGGVVYWIGVPQMEDELGERHQRQMNERIHNINDQLAYLERNLSHWAFMPQFGPMLKEMDFMYYFPETYELSRSLVVLEGSHPLVQHVELYLDREPDVVFKTGYYLVKDETERKRYQQWLNDPQTIYWTGWQESSGSQKENSEADTLRLIHKIPGGSVSRFGVLAITLNKERVINLLRTMTPYNEGATMLFDTQGRHIIGEKVDGEEWSKLGVDIIERMKIEPNGAFMWGEVDSRYSVTYGRLQRLSEQWVYVSAVPIAEIVAPAASLSRAIVSVSLFGLLVALAIALTATGRVYSPLNRLLAYIDQEPGAHGQHDEFRHLARIWQERETASLDLMRRLDEQLPSLRNGFLLQLLQGYLEHDREADLQRKMRQYGWHIDHCFFRVLHVQLVGYGDISGRFPAGNEGLLTFAATNMVEELTERTFPHYGTVNFRDLSIGLLLMDPSSELSRVHTLTDRITAEINRILHIRVVITISEATPYTVEIAERFREAERAAGMRKADNRNQVWLVEELHDHSLSAQGVYPFALERDLHYALRHGNEEMARTTLQRMLDQLFEGEQARRVVRHHLQQLLGGLLQMMLQAGVDTVKLYGSLDLFDALPHSGERSVILVWFIDRVFTPYFSERHAQSADEMQQAVAQVSAVIVEHYSEDLSLDRCAEMTGMSSYTLSRVFKQQMGINFIDYLTDVRLNRATQLLRETDHKVGDIAELVGYQPRYFNRIFKKQLGMTPGQYRKGK